MSKKEFYLYIEGQNVKVSEVVYRVYKSAEEKERYFMKRLKRGRFITDPEGRKTVYIPGREKSFEKLLDEEWEFADQRESVEDMVVKLVEELFYLERTEREVCDALHMAKTTLNRRKQAILRKLKEQMGKIKIIFF